MRNALLLAVLIIGLVAAQDILLEKIDLTDLKASPITLTEDDVFVNLVSNTEQCLGKCEAVFEFRNPTTSDITNFVKSQFQGNILDSKIEIGRDWQIEHALPLKDCATADQYNETSKKTEKVTTCEFNNKWDNWTTTETKWEPFTKFSKVKSGETVYIRIIANKALNTGAHWTPVAKFGTIEVSGDKYAWWNSTWTLRKPITLTEASNHALAGVSIPINVTFVSGGKMNTDFSDVRFANATTQLDHYLDLLSPGVWALYWVFVPDSMSALGQATIYMYYNNSAAIEASTKAALRPIEDGNTRALYYMKDKVGTVITDETGTYNSATTAQCTLNNLTNYGSTLHCNAAAGQGILLNDAATNNMAQGAVSQWICPDAMVSGQEAVKQHDSVNTMVQTTMYNTGLVNFQLTNGKSVNTAVAATVLSKCNHLAFTWDGTGVWSFVNGIFNSSATGSGYTVPNDLASSGYRVGSGQGGAGGGYHGVIMLYEVSNVNKSVTDYSWALYGMSPPTIAFGSEESEATPVPTYSSDAWNATSMVYQGAPFRLASTTWTDMSYAWIEDNSSGSYSNSSYVAESPVIKVVDFTGKGEQTICFRSHANNTDNAQNSTALHCLYITSSTKDWQLASFGGACGMRPVYVTYKDLSATQVISNKGGIMK